MGDEHSSNGRPPSHHVVRQHGDTVLQSSTVTQLLNTPFPQRKRLMPWLREHEAALIYGGAGVGKSWLALSIALAIVGEGQVFPLTPKGALNWGPEPCPKARGWRGELIDGEMHAEDLRDRIVTLREGLELSHPERIDNLWITARQQQRTAGFPLLTNPKDTERLLRIIGTGKSKPDFVIFDNLTTLSELETENDAAAYRPLIESLLLFKAAGIAVLLVHHGGKTDRGNYRGSSSLATTFETILKLKKINTAQDVGTQGLTPAAFALECEKARGGHYVAPLEAKLSTSLAGRCWQLTNVSDRLNALYELLESEQHGTQRELADALGVTPARISQLINTGVESGFWNKGWPQERLRAVKQAAHLEEELETAPQGGLEEDEGGF